MKGAGGLVLRVVTVQYSLYRGDSSGLREQKMHFIVKGVFQIGTGI